MTTAILVVDRVTKRFAGHTAVDALSLTVPPGVIYGLLGPNGAGKSTTIRMIMNIYVPDDGAVHLFGERAWRHRADGAHRLSAGGARALPQDAGARCAAVPGGDEGNGSPRRRAPKSLAWLERLGLGDWQLRKVNELSKGMQQKVQFISTILHDPDLVVMDEPFSGLDPVNAQVLKDTLFELRARGKTILLSTHIMEQAEKICDHVCIIARGKKLVDGTLAEVKRIARRSARARELRRRQR